MPHRPHRSPRFRKRTLRLIALAGGTAGAALVLTAVAARLLVPASRAAGILERRAEERLGRDVSLGAARFTGLSSLRIDGVSLSSGQAPAASADTVLVTTRLLPLLLGRVSVSSLRVDGGSVTWSSGSLTGLTLSAHGLSDHAIPLSGSMRVTWNGLSADAALEGVLRATDRTFTIAKLSLSSGTAAARVSGEVSRTAAAPVVFNLHAEWTGVDPSSYSALAALPEGLSVQGPTSGALDVRTSSGGYVARLRADLSGGLVDWKAIATKEAGLPMAVSAAVTRDGDLLTLRDIDVRLASVHARGEGEVRGTGDATRLASLRFNSIDVDIADLFRHLGVGVPDGVEISGPATATVSVDGGTRGGRFVADIDGSRLEVGYRSLFRKRAGIPLRLLADGRYATPLAVDVSSLRVDVGALRMSGRGSYTPGKDRPTYTFRLKTNAFPFESVAELTPLLERFRPTGHGVMSLRIIRGEGGPAMSGDLTLVSAGASLGGSTLSDLAGGVHFTDDAFSARLLTGRLDGSALRADLSAHRYGGRAFVEADLRVDELNLQTMLSRPLAGAAAPFDTAGVLHAGHIEHAGLSADDLTLEWNLSGVSSAEPADLNGTASWRQGPGRFGPLAGLVSASAPARAFLLPMAVLQSSATGVGYADVRAGLDALVFEALDADISIKESEVTLAPFLVQGGEKAVGLKGRFRLELSDGLNLTARLRDNARPGVVSLSLSGSAAAPVIAATRP